MAGCGWCRSVAFHSDTTSPMVCKPIWNMTPRNNTAPDAFLIKHNYLPNACVTTLPPDNLGGQNESNSWESINSRRLHRSVINKWRTLCVHSLLPGQISSQSGRIDEAYLQGSCSGQLVNLISQPAKPMSGATNLFSAKHSLPWLWLPCVVSNRYKIEAYVSSIYNYYGCDLSNVVVLPKSCLI